MCQSVGSMERVCEGAVETYTPRGHVVGMLDRDQRTAKVPTYQKRAECQNLSAVAGEQVCRGNVPHSWKSRGWKTRVRETAQRLKQVLVVGTYLLSIVSIPSSLSAPTGRRMDRLNSQEKWINPCDYKLDEGTAEQPPDPFVFINPIIDQAKISLIKAKDFKKDFMERFDKSMMTAYENEYFGFLPVLPKKLNETVSEEHLRECNLKDSLINIYEYLQRIAVGLEAVTWGQEDHQEPFLAKFNETEYNLRSVLCEVQAAIVELGFWNNKKDDIKRDAMDDTVRFYSNVTSRYPRDWAIYREYMNALEYTIQVFDYLKTQQS